MTTQPLSQSRLANLAAPLIAQTFDAYHARFRAITARACWRFEQRDWPGLYADATERLELYRRVVDPTVGQVRDLLGDRVEDRLTWAGMKAVYSGLIAERDDWELAETFFNSITRRIFCTVGVDPAIEFVDTDFDSPPTAPARPVQRTYAGPMSPRQLMRAVLDDYRPSVGYADQTADVELAAGALARQLAAMSAAPEWADAASDDGIHAGATTGNGRLPTAVIGAAAADPVVDRAEMLRPVFYRNKGAYLVGRLWSAGRLMPLAIALVHPAEGVSVEALLLDENDLSRVFSFAHWYFHVATERPHEVVSFLRSVMPRKRVAELYISLGYHKHGKTELYRDLLGCLAASDERFEVAPGEAGMIMEVFTLPSYDLVLKVIKDRFSEPKQTTRRSVMERYHLVFQHDRAGRLVDAQEFEELRFDGQRFAPDLLQRLLSTAADTVRLVDGAVVIRHAYIERRVTPLDIYLRRADLDAARAAALDFGQAIKDLAACNIFPGDFFAKNFGVTRHGRVVSYDYDELCLVTDCCFRPMPAPADELEALAAEPWFHVREGDVFPEEFRRYLRLPRGLDADFVCEHADLFEVSFWQAMQARVRAGEVVDIFPYAPSRRLRAQP